MFSATCVHTAFPTVCTATSTRRKTDYDKALTLQSPYSFAMGPVQLVDPAEWPKIGLLNRVFGNILSILPRKNSKPQSSLNFLQCRPRKFTKSDFSGLAPIRWIPTIAVFGVREFPKHYSWDLSEPRETQKPKSPSSWKVSNWVVDREIQGNSEPQFAAREANSQPTL